MELAQVAYKLYFLENADIGNLVIEDVWKPGKPFLLHNWHHVTELIRNAIKKEYKFENLNERTEYKSIADGFKEENLNKGFTHPYFDDLAPFFKLKTFQVFQEELNLRDKYLDLARKQVGYSGLIGLYFFVSCSARRTGLVKYPVLIDKDGEVKIKVLDQLIVKGKARLLPDGRFVMIDFTSYFKQGPFMGAFLIDKDLLLQRGSCEGVSMRINKSNWAQGKREFIITCKDLNPEKNVR